jgi:signal transduction histidine kinase
VKKINKRKRPVLKKKKPEHLAKSALFQKVSEICAAVNVATDGKELLEISLKGTMELFGAERGSIFILKENGKDLILKIARGMEVNEEQDMVKRLGEGVVGRVAESKKPIFVQNIAKDNRFENFKARKSYRTPSFICAPLLIKDVLIGVINIADKTSGQKFSENELQLLDFLSSQIALNFRRIQLYEKFKKIVKESKTLKDELGKTSEETTHLKQQVIQQEKLASIGKLAGGIAHEFNNPLDGVMRYTNLCLEQVREDEVVRGYLLEVKHGLNRMANIVRSLLACSRNTDPGGMKVDPNVAVEQALQGLSVDLLNKNITVKKDLTEGLPALTDFGLERIVSNLVRNSIDAVADGGQIEISSKLQNSDLVLKIKDNGCGIPTDGVQKIFEPFYTTKDIDKGCGLGLTIVSEIVKTYSGEILVDSDENKGTTFTIVVPVNLK